KKTVDPILEAAVKRELCAENLVLAKDEEQSANADTKNCQRAGIHVGRGWQFHRIFCSCTDRTGSYPSFENPERSRARTSFKARVRSGPVSSTVYSAPALTGPDLTRVLKDVRARDRSGFSRRPSFLAAPIWRLLLPRPFASWNSPPFQQ